MHNITLMLHVVIRENPFSHGFSILINNCSFSAGNVINPMSEMDNATVRVVHSVAMSSVILPLTTVCEPIFINDKAYSIFLAILEEALELGASSLPYKDSESFFFFG